MKSLPITTRSYMPQPISHKLQLRLNAAKNKYIFFKVLKEKKMEAENFISSKNNLQNRWNKDTLREPKPERFDERCSSDWREIIPGGIPDFKKEYRASQRVNICINEKDLFQTFIFIPIFSQVFLKTIDCMEKEMATHYSILAWRILWTEEPGGSMLSMGSHQVRHDWSNLAAAATLTI